MKVAKVVPLFKAGEKDIFTNYRPVSLLPQFSKVLEKLFNKRLDEFIDKFEILCESQYGFRSNRSTSHAILELMENVTNALDRKQSVIGIFIDLKKAFDTINHNLLLSKLEYYGIRGLSNKWLHSYLCNRKQYVVIEDTESDLLSVQCGVPQGSILGPKLFILYINDLANISDILQLILFADDTNAFCAGKDVIDLTHKITDELSIMKEWFDINKLSLNVSKTKYMVFTNCKINCEIKISINDISIERVHVTKFLGVLMDENLNWKAHINSIGTKLAKTVSVFYKVRNLLNKGSLYTLYCSLFLPYLNYCVEAWGNTYINSVKPIYLLQKKVIRIMHGVSYNDHTNDLFYNSKVVKLYDLVKFKTACIMYRAKNQLLPNNIQKLFNEKSHIGYDLRDSRHFSTKYCRTTKKSMCVSIKGVSVWNSIDITIRQAKSFSLFKQLLKKNIFEVYKTQATSDKK